MSSGKATTKSAKSMKDDTEVSQVLSVEEIITYSLSPAFQTNSSLLQHASSAYSTIEAIIQASKHMLPSMNSILEAMESSLGVTVVKLNRKREERLLFEILALNASYHSQTGKRHHITSKDFFEKYRCFKSLDIPYVERVALVKFRNYLAVALQMIPIHQNKDHLLDLVTRCVDGTGIRRITGSGATMETRRRIVVLSAESGEIPEDSLDPTSTSSSSIDSIMGIDTSASKRRVVKAKTKKRGRPRKYPLPTESNEPLHPVKSTKIRVSASASASSIASSSASSNFKLNINSNNIEAPPDDNERIATDIKETVNSDFDFDAFDVFEEIDYHS